MKIYLITFLGETIDLNSADSFVATSKESAWDFINDDAKQYKDDYDVEEIERTDSRLTLGGGDEYFTWEIKEREIWGTTEKIPNSTPDYGKDWKDEGYEPITADDGTTYQVYAFRDKKTDKKYVQIASYIGNAEFIPLEEVKDLFGESFVYVERLFNY